MMGRRLAEQGAEVELMISSPATRAMATAEAIAEELDYPWDGVVTEERLYEADAEEILTVIEEQDDWIDHLMVIGHNPGLTALVNILSQSGVENVPTCGVVELKYDVESWVEVAEVKPIQVAFDYPKKHRG
jgi:phosphohistidine phosphatase